MTWLSAGNSEEWAQNGNKTLRHLATVCATRADKILDRCCGPIQGAYKSVPLPPLGSADPNTILLASAYASVVRRAERQKKTFKNRTDTSIGELQSCFELTNWDLFLSDSLDLNDQVLVVSSYIHFCVESIIPTKSFPNNKPWVTKEL